MADNIVKFNPAMTDSNAYVGKGSGTGKDNNHARHYLYKGAGHMVHVRDWEPQRNNNFEVVITGLSELTLADGSTVKPPNAAERLMLSVESFSAPQIDIAQITTHYANNSIKWAGKPEFPNSTLVINDYIGIETEKILAAWFRCAYDFKTETIGWATNYKKTAYLIEYAPNGEYARTWRLDGCWLASMQLGDWNQQGNEQRKLSATLVYDRVIPDYELDALDDWDAESAGSVNAVAGEAVNLTTIEQNRDRYTYVTSKQTDNGSSNN